MGEDPLGEEMAMRQNDRWGNPPLTRGPDMDRVAKHLATGLKPEPKPEPKWGLDRRRAITLAMVHPDKRKQRHEVITFIRKVCRANDLTHFYEERATETDMQNVERILGL